MKPILFGTQMVQALLNGQKTQTRRPVRPQPPKDASVAFVRAENAEDLCGLIWRTDRSRGYQAAPCQPGDVLWVRETWNVNNLREDGDEYEVGFIYKAAEKPDYGFRWVKTSPESYEKYMDGMSLHFDKWRPSIHMPRAAARIFLRVTDVRVERLRDIDENGAIAEGLYKGWRLCGMGSLALSARQAFMWLWGSITRKAPVVESWACNPWVWVIEFKRCEKEGRSVNG